MNRTLILTVLVVLAGAFGLARAQEAAEPDPKEAALAAIDAGRAALVAGDSQQALDDLQKAIGIIQQTLGKELENFLPAALDGWTRGDVDVSSGNWGSGESSFRITTARCEYEEKEGEGRVSMQLSNSPQLIQGLKGMVGVFQNPQYREMMKQQGVTVEELSAGGLTGWYLVQADGSAQVMVATEGLMLQIEGDADSGAAVKSYWNAIDHAGLAKAGKR